MFLVIDGKTAHPQITGGNNLTHDENYRIIALSGATYSEPAGLVTAGIHP